MRPHSWARADPEFSCIAGLAGRALSRHSIHPSAQHPFPRRTSIPLQTICPCPVCPQPLFLPVPGHHSVACCAMHPRSQPQNPLAPGQGAAGVLIIFIPDAEAGVPTTGFWRSPPRRLGPRVSPELLRGGWGLAMPGRLCLFPVRLCPASVVSRFACTPSQFSCAPNEL